MSFLFGAITFLVLDAELAELNRFVSLTDKVQKAAEGRGAKWGFHDLYLLNDPHVASTLGLNTKQQQDVAKLTQQYLEKIALTIRERKINRIKSSSGAVAKVIDGPRQQLDKLYADKALDSLSKQQRARLVQIKLQLRSVEIFYYREVLDQLSVTDQQKQRLEKYRHEIAQQTQRWRLKRETCGVSSAEATKAIDAILDSHRNRVVALLSREQHDIYKRLTGIKIGFQRADLRLSLKVNSEYEQSKKTTRASFPEK